MKRLALYLIFSPLLQAYAALPIDENFLREMQILMEGIHSKGLAISASTPYLSELRTEGARAMSFGGEPMPSLLSKGATGESSVFLYTDSMDLDTAHRTLNSMNYDEKEFADLNLRPAHRVMKSMRIHVTQGDHYLKANIEPFYIRVLSKNRPVLVQLHSAEANWIKTNAIQGVKTALTWDMQALLHAILRFSSKRVWNLK